MIAIIKILFENKKIRDLIKQKWSACVHRWVTRSVARHIFFATACQLLFLDRSSMAFVLLRFFVCCYNSIPLSFVLCKGQNPDSSFSTSIRLCSFNFVRGGWFCFLFKTFAVFFCEQLRQVVEPSGFRFEPDDDSIKKGGLCSKSQTSRKIGHSPFVSVSLRKMSGEKIFASSQQKKRKIGQFQTIRKQLLGNILWQIINRYFLVENRPRLFILYFYLAIDPFNRP